MNRVATFVVLSSLLALTMFAGATFVGEGAALAQNGVKERPTIRGRTFRVKIDSSPQQAAVFWDAGPSPKDYGVAGYTPITLKVPRGIVKFTVELRGFKPQDREVNVRKNQTLTFTMERAPQPGRLDLRAGGDRNAEGAEAYIDGVLRGTIPNTFELVAGRHQLEVKKQGFKTLSDWVDIGEDERRTRDVQLEKAEQPGGALLVTSEGGGDVWVDGVRKDVAPAVINGVPAGEHVVEVRKDGQPPWRQTVVVVAGQQTKVAANLASAGGSQLRVIASEPDVEIFVDGDDKGRAPLTVKDMAPGQHIVEGRKPKFKSTSQSVRVAPGEQVVVEVKMDTAADRARSSLKVQSTVPNAEVFVDGSSMGRAPIDRTDLEPGKHYIVVHKDGFTDFKREVILIENQPVALVADLSATGAVRILSTPEGADVRIDGELVGKTPLHRDSVQAGDHVIEFRQKGYFDHKETVKVEGGREKLFSVDLKQLPTGPSPEQQARRKAGMSSFGARVNPVGGVTADAGIGYPYYFTLRLTVGAFAIKPLGMDMGVEFQTFFQMADLNLHGRLQLVEVGPLAVAVRADIGGGFGRNGRNTVFGDASAIASLAFSDVATFFVSGRFSWWYDRFCPGQTERNNGTEADDFCGDPAKGVPAMTSLFGGQDPNDHWFSGNRLYAGVGVTASLDHLTSLYFQIEFLPFPSQFGYEPRQAFTDKINSAMFDKDTFVYGSAGVSLKF
ncbi:MAG TPA: PEGA domain-containing protein [Polyangia bacterium]|nr:PEGA domain-containing protein [Polyangia bacterium]